MGAGSTDRGMGKLCNALIVRMRDLINADFGILIAVTFNLSNRLA